MGAVYRRHAQCDGFGRHDRGRSLESVRSACAHAQNRISFSSGAQAALRSNIIVDAKRPIEPEAGALDVASHAPAQARVARNEVENNVGRHVRLYAGVAVSLLLLLVFARSLVELAMYVAGVELHSHILLVPLIVAYLLYIRSGELPKRYRSSPVPAAVAFACGTLALVAATRPAFRPPVISANDHLALVTLSFVCCLVAAGFAILGSRWMRAAAFPVFFLLFLVPLPDAVAEMLETASKLGSAEVTDLFFTITGTPSLRNGTVFRLPGISIEVAQECSGIRSSFVLLITSLLASNLFLRTAWRRTVLVLFVLPLGLLRNGFRILVISLLCVHIGPEMIHSIIHRRGGPLFFLLSMIPLFLLLWWLRSQENRKRKRSSVGAAAHV